MGELDMLQRDPNNLNEHVKCDFEDAIGEPEGIHSIDCVWRIVNKCYLCTQGLCYKLPTLLCGWAYAIGWGAVFAWLGLCHIWCFTPIVKVVMTTCTTFQRCWSSCMNCCLRPICEACGGMFSTVNIVKSTA